MRIWIVTLLSLLSFATELLDASSNFVRSTPPAPAAMHIRLKKPVIHKSVAWTVPSGSQAPRAPISLEHIELSHSAVQPAAGTMPARFETVVAFAPPPPPGIRSAIPAHPLRPPAS